MNKKWVMISLFLLFACGSPPDLANPENPQNQNNSQKEADSFDPIDPNINFYITFDLLGGVFRTNQNSSAGMTLASEESLEAGLAKSSPTHLPASDETQAQPEPNDVYQRESFIVDYSQQYLGFEGKGRMSLSAFGEGEEIFSPNDPQDRVQHFSHLTLRFVFHNYAFNNPCLGVIKLKGEIACEVEGDYEVKTARFLGQARCQNGPMDNPAPVLYKMPQQRFAIELNATLEIDGDPYRYRSYSYEGVIVIDGEEMPIEENILKGVSCSAVK